MTLQKICENLANLAGQMGNSSRSVTSRKLSNKRKLTMKTSVQTKTSKSKPVNQNTEKFHKLVFAYGRGGAFWARLGTYTQPRVYTADLAAGARIRSMSGALIQRYSKCTSVPPSARGTSV